MIEKTTDFSLLRQVRLGQQDAATALYLRYATQLRRMADRTISADLAVRVSGEDIVQSVFRTFFRRASNGQYDIGDADGFWRLLLVIALNKIRACGNHHRASKRSVSRTQPLEHELDSPVSRDDEESAFQILKLTIDELIRSLPPEHHEIVYMRIEGREINEIAEKTRRAKRSIERILQGFRKQLSETLEVQS
jgi:RNA polymerase sigma-70 factor (ECF subfamily)